MDKLQTPPLKGGEWNRLATKEQPLKRDLRGLSLVLFYWCSNLGMFDSGGHAQGGEYETHAFRGSALCCSGICGDSAGAEFAVAVCDHGRHGEEDSRYDHDQSDNGGAHHGSV